MEHVQKVFNLRLLFFCTPLNHYVCGSRIADTASEPLEIATSLRPLHQAPGVSQQANAIVNNNVIKSPNLKNCPWSTSEPQLA